MEVMKRIGNYILLTLFLSISVVLMIFIYSLSIIAFLSQTAAAVVVNFIELVQYAPKVVLSKVQRASRLIRKEMKKLP